MNFGIPACRRTPRLLSRRTPRFLSRAVCCFLFVSVISLTGQSQSHAWKRQRVASLAWLHAVFFLDVNRGWAVGSRGTLLATLDGGKTWQTKSQPTPDVLRDIYFTDEQNGWLLCEANVYELKGKADPR
ncbi:MAG: YCF48-related protein, partial [bacterium]